MAPATPATRPSARVLALTCWSLADVEGAEAEGEHATRDPQQLLTEMDGHLRAMLSQPPAGSSAQPPEQRAFRREDA
jgi:hypothetical protein